MPVGYSIYVERPSAIHQRIDPRTKLAALGTVFVLALAFNHPAVLGGILLLVLLAARLAQLPWRSLLPFLVGSIWFLVLGLLIWPLYVQGGPHLFTLLGVRISLNGILFGLAMGLRVALMVLAAGVWMMTTSPQKLTVGLLRLGLPYKAGVAMTAAIRFVPLLNAERITISEAQQARALDLRREPLPRRVLKSIAIIGPLFIRSIDVAQALALALEARGFAARDGRTSIIQIEMTPADRGIVLLLAVACVSALALRVLGLGLISREYL
jgi:energy-coupling factor transport system permease protein